MSRASTGAWRAISSRARDLASRQGGQGDLLRIGLVGSGERGASYPQAITNTGNAKLTMVADRDGDLARELGERLGVPWTTESSVDSGGFVPASTCFDSGGRSYGRWGSSPTSVIGPA